MVMLSSKNDIN